MKELAAAYELFRRGQFADARAEALMLCTENAQNFWATYLAAVSSAFLPELKDFEKFLADLDNFVADGDEFVELPSRADARKTLAGNVYLHYLKAYYALLQNDVERALWHYLEIAEDDEGWLARSLIKKFRKTKEIKNVGFRVADFIVLPGELPPRRNIEAAEIENGAKANSVANVTKVGPGWQFGKRGKRLQPLRIRFASFSYLKLLSALSLAFAIMAAVLFWRNQVRPKITSVPIPDLQVADSAAVMPVPDATKVLYRYRTREGIIADFDRAKDLLRGRKVNQARYMLQRLVHSNADFQTREKSRTFVGFIPDPEFTDFDDNLRLRNLFEDVRLRRDSLVVVGGELRDSVNEGNGTLYQFIATENGEEFRVHAYRNELVKEETRGSGGGKKSIQIYGRFKGLVGAQQAIYLEALRVWR